jgi:hypothetical protein
MHVHILDLDGSICRQQELLARHEPTRSDLRDWGPSLRLGCGFGRFRRFEKVVAASMPPACRPSVLDEPTVTLYGSGDFHHVSLALVRRLAEPYNLLVLDNHPDWMRGIPFLHCGTWVYHAARYPLVQRIFHLGGDVDFDNHYAWLAPWPDLLSGKITVLPSVRRFRGRYWGAIPHSPLRAEAAVPATADRLAELLEPFRDELSRRPLYVSLDKDVMGQSDAVVNWDSGHLQLAEVENILAILMDLTGGNLAGMDIVGDWSPVRVQGMFRQTLHLTEHPSLTIDPDRATEENERTNLALLRVVGAGVVCSEPAASLP